MECFTQKKEKTPAKAHLERLDFVRDGEDLEERPYEGLAREEEALRQAAAESLEGRSFRVLAPSRHQADLARVPEESERRAQRAKDRGLTRPLTQPAYTRSRDLSDTKASHTWKSESTHTHTHKTTLLYSKRQKRGIRIRTKPIFILGQSAGAPRGVASQGAWRNARAKRRDDDSRNRAKKARGPPRDALRVDRSIGTFISSLPPPKSKVLVVWPFHERDEEL